MIRGQKKSFGTFRGVKGTLDVYIGRCDMSVDANILKKYIQDEIGLNIVNCECLSNDHAHSRSFKVSVTADKRDTLLDANLWSEDIVVRKYFKPRNNNGS